MAYFCVAFFLAPCFHVNRQIEMVLAQGVLFFFRRRQLENKLLKWDIELQKKKKEKKNERKKEKNWGILSLALADLVVALG